jgi:signal transduction histidine kinase
MLAKVRSLWRQTTTRVTRHGGQLDLTSEVGQGTRATVRLHARVPGSPAR